MYKRRAGGADGRTFVEPAENEKPVGTGGESYLRSVAESTTRKSGTALQDVL